MWKRVVVVLNRIPAFHGWSAQTPLEDGAEVVHCLGCRVIGSTHFYLCAAQNKMAMQSRSAERWRKKKKKKKNDMWPCPRCLLLPPASCLPFKASPVTPLPD